MREVPVVSRAAAAIRRNLDVPPEAALVLGSGLGELADAVESPVVVPTAEIEGYPASTVPGHLGRLVFGRLEGVDLVIIQGRVHAYEGYSPARVAFPIRLVHALGAGRILLTNAAGGISAHLRPGALMFITDHINVAGGCFGLDGGAAAMPLGARTRLRTSPYSVPWTHRAERAALRSGIATQRGIYLWTAGPSYETRAEIAAFRRLGADAVGMSTVPEALQAAALDMEVLGISTITNRAAGLGAGTLSHQDVLAAGRRARGDLERLLRSILRART